MTISLKIAKRGIDNPKRNYCIRYKPGGLLKRTAVRALHFNFHVQKTSVKSYI